MATAKEPTHGQIIKGLTLGQSKALEKLDGEGAGGGCLEARRYAAGVVLTWRYSEDGKTDRIRIGLYDPTASPNSTKPTAKGYSIKAAKNRAAEMFREHQAARMAQGLGYREAKKELKAAAQRALVEAEAATRQAAEAEKVRKHYTLERLLSAYCDHLEKLGRRSHTDARGIFKLHVVGAFPKLAALPACDVTADNVDQMLRKLYTVDPTSKNRHDHAPRGRTANKLRAYLGAAYKVAIGHRRGDRYEFKGYNITVSPVTGTERDTASDKADKAPLTADEMRTYWQCIEGMGGFKGQALRLHLLTGGQRIEQLVKARRSSPLADCITLLDGKGRPGKAAREHTVPLVGSVLGDVEALRTGEGEWLLSTDGGKSHLGATTLSGWAKAATGDKIKGFQAKRIRSGVETLLASARLSRDQRGRLQSHGVGGVQAAHYDAHDYLPEKREALETLRRLLDQVEQPSNVVLLRANG